MIVAELTKENFEREILQAKEPVLIDFWAPWCGPCRQMSPVIDELAEELEDVKVVKVNVDEEAELAVGFGVISIPTLVLLHHGEALQSSVGLRSKQEVVDMVHRALGKEVEAESA